VDVRRWSLAAAILLMPLAAAGPLTADSSETRGVPEAGAWDAVEHFRAWQGPEVDIRYGPAFAAMPDGRLVSAVGDPLGEGGCALSFADQRLTTQQRVPIPACDGAAGSSIILSAGNDAVLLCRRTVPVSTPVLLAVDPQGETIWAKTPQDLVPLSVQGTVTWSCNGGALRDGRLVATFTMDGAGAGSGYPGDHAIIAFDAATGDVVWDTEVQTTDNVAMVVGSDVSLHPSGGPDYAGFAPLTVTALDRGYIVTGIVGGTCALVLLHPDGIQEEILYASETPFGRPPVPSEGLVLDRAIDQLPPASCTGWAAPAGPFAITAFGPEVVRLDPLAPSPLDRTTPELTFPFLPHAALGPAQSGGDLVVPVQNGVVILDRETLQVRGWHRLSPQPWYSMWDFATTPSGNVWVVGADAEDGTFADLVTPTGRLVQRLPLGLDLPGQTGFRHSVMRLVPLDDGFVVVDADGYAVRFGQGEDSLMPKATLEDAYPAVDASFGLGVRPVAEAVATQVFWGDGGSSTLMPGERLTWRYGEAGEKTVRVTSIFADNRTATTTVAVHVGQDPPERLSFIQRAFAPENSEMTWGVIGLILALFSGIGAFAAWAWRRRGMSSDLRELDRIRASAVAQPLDALGDLRRYRRELRRRAAKGNLDGAAFASLAQEADTLARALQHRLLVHFEGRLGPRLRAIVDTALADGILASSELDAIGAALDGEARLTPGERRDLGRLLADWS
jgi:hypothetical protein